VAVAELAAYVLVTALATWLLEKDLLLEARGYLRGRSVTLAPDRANLPDAVL
jgi:hypothetical protein